MNGHTKTLLAFLLAAFISCSIYGQRKQEFNKTFDKKERVKLNSVLGDCSITKSSDGKIHVLIEYTYDPDEYEIYYHEGSSSLDVEEEFDAKNPRGYSKWEVALPDGIDLKIKSATGNIKVEGLDIEIDGNSGTGNFDIKKCSGIFELNSGTGNLFVIDSKGEFEMNSGTGNIELKSVKGRFEMNSGTGNVEADGITIDGESDLNSGTGDVIVKLADALKEDLSLNSGTGDSELNMNGFELNGYFELSCNEDNGRVKCPVDSAEERVKRHHGEDQIIYSFKKGSASVQVKISTGSGTAQLTL